MIPEGTEYNRTFKLSISELGLNPGSAKFNIRFSWLCPNHRGWFQVLQVCSALAAKKFEVS